MSSQQHGKKFEDIMKAAFPGSADTGRLANASFDIEAIFDKECGLPTSIKSGKILKNVIEMADARKFLANDSPFRLLNLLYRQTEEYKIVERIDEYIFSSDILKIIKGNYSYDDIENFHNIICSYEHGDHLNARRAAKEIKKSLKHNSIFLILNAKIGNSDNQRRLQCSIIINKLLTIMERKTYINEYRDICLPLKIKSQSRSFL